MYAVLDKPPNKVPTGFGEFNKQGARTAIPLNYEVGWKFEFRRW